VKNNPFATIDAGRRRRPHGDRRSSAAARPAPTSSSASAANTAATPPPSNSATSSGLNYVSCSPFRVPVARLAAAAGGARIIRSGYYPQDSQRLTQMNEGARASESLISCQNAVLALIGPICPVSPICPTLDKYDPLLTQEARQRLSRICVNLP